jgi:heme-degrading monooxygenase HmoA
MIVRAWNGYASAANADAYPRHLLRTVRPKLERLAGFRGLYLLRRGGRDEVHYQVLTLWDSMHAIRAFAGDQPNHAVVEPEAQALLVRFDSLVSHFDVLAGPTL